MITKSQPTCWTFPRPKSWYHLRLPNVSLQRIGTMTTPDLIRASEKRSVSWGRNHWNQGPGATFSPICNRRYIFNKLNFQISSFIGCHVRKNTGGYPSGVRWSKGTGLAFCKPMHSIKALRIKCIASLKVQADEQNRRHPYPELTLFSYEKCKSFKKFMQKHREKLALWFCGICHSTSLSPSNYQGTARPAQQWCYKCYISC